LCELRANGRIQATDFHDFFTSSARIQYMAIRMVVFDVAGTTVVDFDNAVASKLVEAPAACGVNIAPEEVNPLMGVPKPLAVRTLLEQVRGGWQALKSCTTCYEDQEVTPQWCGPRSWIAGRRYRTRCGK
jgi:hypothetical protein